MAACTCSVVAVAGVVQWLCGASNVVTIATAGPCGVAARGAQAAGVMAPHELMPSLGMLVTIITGWGFTPHTNSGPSQSTRINRRR